MPLIIFTFGILFFHCRPRHLMCGLFPAGIIAAIGFVLVLLPGAIERLFVDLLGMGG